MSALMFIICIQYQQLQILPQNSAVARAHRVLAECLCEAWKLHLNIPPSPNDRERTLGKGSRFSLSSPAISASRGQSSSHSQWWSGLELPPAQPVPPRAVLDVHARGGTQRSRRGGGGGGCGARRGNGCRKQAGR
ncbi:uncharacterized [Tachysurus ichikawai]